MKFKIDDGTEIVVRQVAWHRNGVGGTGFHAVLFDNPGKGLMVAIVFDEPGCCAVLKVEPLSTAVGVAFGENSWRGDVFESALREAIKVMPSDGSLRLGPFAMPTVRKGE